MEKIASVKEKFHPGERAIQRKAGEEDIANLSARIIADSIVKGAIDFIERQPMIVVSSIGSKGQIWVSLLVGHPGFTKVPQPNILFFDQDAVLTTREDIFYKNIQENPEIGSLLIELPTRRRFRINGKISQVGSGLKVEIHEAYPNCPKYIQRRIVTVPEYSQTPATFERGSELTLIQKNWITTADTFFVGSGSKTGKLDASHRGGNKGFVQVLDNNTLKIPDYKGNSFFNTLGNFNDNPNAGLLFIDFNEGKTLQLTGKATLLFDQHSGQDLEATGGTGRYWLFHPEQWILISNHHRINFEFIEYSHFNP